MPCHAAAQQQQQQQLCAPRLLSCTRSVSCAAGKGFGVSKAAPPKSCPCGSGKEYKGCCEPYHKGADAAATPELLLRSRFAAYKMGLAEYIVATTHPDNPEHTGDSYLRKVKKTANQTQFLKLNIAEQQLPAPACAGPDDAYLTFTVTWKPRVGSEQGKQAQSDTETSHFVKEGGRWLYRDYVESTAADLASSGL